MWQLWIDGSDFGQFDDIFEACDAAQDNAIAFDADEVRIERVKESE